MTPQLEIAQGRHETIAMLAAHTHHLQLWRAARPSGECSVPVELFTYPPTRQPVILDWWSPPPSYPNPPEDGLRFTTVSSWEQTHKDIAFDGETYTWSKSSEFIKLLEVPRRAGVLVELALGIDEPATMRMLRRHGFGLLPIAPISRDPAAYRIHHTLGAEFTAAKDQNVRLRSGWFSDRRRHLSGNGTSRRRPGHRLQRGAPDGHRPAPVPHGRGGGRRAKGGHGRLPTPAGRTAHEIAHEHFRAETVLARLLSDAGLG